MIKPQKAVSSQKTPKAPMATVVKSFMAPDEPSAISQEARKQIDVLHDAYRFWDGERDHSSGLPRLLEQVKSVAQLLPSQDLPSREYLYYQMGRCMSDNSRISADSRQDNKRAYYLRMHLMNELQLEDMWRLFDEDFSSMFDRCIDSHGVDHAVGFLQKFC